ncbi:MAG: RNA polymerase sigma factor [Acutalibacteraceae bacterium]
MSKLDSEQKNNALTQESIDAIIVDCEQYRKQLIEYCLQYFECEYEYAEDCVQNAYVALYESLKKGIKINNCKSWLYSVTLNYKNKVIKDKIVRNEYDFTDNEEKDNTINNAISYNPDYIDSMVSDKTIEERAIRIISTLNPNEKKLFKLYYWEHKKLKEIAEILGITYDTVRKRHEKLKKKIIKMIKEFEDY